MEPGDIWHDDDENVDENADDNITSDTEESMRCQSSLADLEFEAGLGILNHLP